MSNSLISTIKNAPGQSSDISSTNDLFSSQSKQRVSSSSGMSQLTSGSRLNSRRQQQQQQQIINTKVNKIAEQDEYVKIATPKLKLEPSSYCVSINQDGAMTMDKVSHLNTEQIQMQNLEHSLRPISGIRNHVKRNHISSTSLTETGFDILKETDLIQRIGSVKTLKRLDLSNNYLKKYPIQLCDLPVLESLNLSSNNIDETVLPDEVAKYENLIELILDSNKFKKLPKCIAKLKKLTRLSIRSNNLSDMKYLHHLKKLRFLVLDNNLLTELDEKIKNLEKLEILHIKHNLITSLDSNLVKNSLSFLKQLDLSSNKLNVIAIEVFLLPLLEVLNLSNNKLSRLPVVPPHQIRSQPLFVCDISSNSLIRFYDFLLIIAKNIDLSSNKIKNVQNKTIERLTTKQIESKILKLEENPLISPPIEVCKLGLKYIKNWFEEEAKKIQLNKGFKILLFGEQGSGKTTLAYALEDFNSNTNLIEQIDTTSTDQPIQSIESKFVEIRDFYMKSTIIDSDDDDCNDESNVAIMRTESRQGHDIIIESTPLPLVNLSRSNSHKEKQNATGSIQRKRSARSGSARSTQSNSASSISSSGRRAKITAPTINAFSNINLTSTETHTALHQPLTSTLLAANKKENKMSRMPIHIYDFNGSINQFAHVLHLFMDKTALLICVIDCSKIDLTTHQQLQPIEESWKAYLKELIDIIILKINKTNNYYIIPVLTKSDKILKPQINVKLNDENVLFNKQIIQSAITKVQEFITDHINSRLNDIKIELKKIESLTKITASQSERLKSLIQIQANLQPHIHKQWHVVSAIKMDGIELLSKDIQSLVSNDKKLFPFVNEKVPTFWQEVEKQACNQMTQMYLQSSNPHLPMSMLCVDYEFYKDSIIEKFGMAHLIDSITKYLSSSGKIIWIQDSEKTRQKVFLRPNALFDMLFVLFRKNFSENFADTYSRNNKQSKYLFKLSDDLIVKYTADLVEKGCLNLDILKLIWFPILTVESTELVQDCFVLLSSFFNFGYPAEIPSKSKMKQLYSFRNNTEEDEFEPKVTFTQMVIPFYLPLSDTKLIAQLRAELIEQTKKAITFAIKHKLKSEIPKHFSKLAQKYTFPWGLKAGIFERFSNTLILNTELYFKSHYKNMFQAFNEENSIGSLVYFSKQDNETTDQVIFEFYIVSYQHVLESVNNIQEFEQSLTMDLDQLWLLALRVLQLFEDIIVTSYPGLRFDRYSQCPECEKFSFLGEWLTPKELQKNKFKNCSHCDQLIEYEFLVKPATAQNPSLDFKKLQQRLENLAQNEIRKSASIKSRNSNNPSRTITESQNENKKSKSNIDKIK